MTPSPLHRSDPTGLGPYRLVGRLAVGGMGRVYLAVHSGTGELAAVKTLLVEEIGDTDRQRFAREAALARRVPGRHTARLLDAAPGERRPWLATEYVPAPSLGELVARGGPVDAVTAAWLAAECATALTALHSAGVVHRDLKPQNILLSADGVKVIDFGISHATDLTRTRLTLGTLAYIAPEQARGEPATPAGDVYGLGATLCTLATGRAPYPDVGDPIQLLGLVARGAVDTAEVPEPLLGLVSACLAADPADRPRPDELRERAEAVGRAGASRMPDRWAGIVLAYQRQGRELAGKYASTPVPGADGPAYDESPPHDAEAMSAESPPDTRTSPRRTVGLTPRGWRAAGGFAANCAGLGLFLLGALAVLATVIVIVVAVATD
ncbi:serine/threonine-protein kinase [Streptomyces sp. NPDC015144]|uniref:serine/threonine-protein kinase n=1 Tax=Streptomyces sp. NPDC015144 TaxID=3364944 RepID=UPI0036F54A49